MRSATPAAVNLPLALLASLGLVLSAGCDRPSASAGASESVPVAKETPERPGLSAAPTPAAPPQPTPSATPADGMPVISFPSMVHDFGRILETDKATARLEFTNTGDAPLLIEDIKTSCGCTVAKPDRRRYEPGESGHVEVEFDPAGPGDGQRKYVKVIANTEPKITQVAITADVDPFVIIEPRTMELGVLPYGQPQRYTLRVSSIDPQFTIEAVRTTNPAVTATVLGVLEPADGTNARTDGVEVTIAADAPWGPLFSWFEMDVRGRPNPDAAPITYEAKMRIQGQLFGHLRTEPDTFRFGAAPGEPFERTVRVRRADGEPFSILSTDVTADRIVEPVVRVDQIGPGEYEVLLSATGGSTMAMATGAVVLITDVPGEEQVAIPISGMVRRVANVGR